MKYEKFFELAKLAGIEEAELYIDTSYSLSVSLFHSEIDEYTVEDGMNVSARGIINGKFGVATADSFNEEKAKFLVEEIVKNAKIIENDDPAFLFQGSKKYHKINSYNKALAEVPVEEKIAKLYELEAKVKALDERVFEVEGVTYSESAGSTLLMNSNGLKLSQKANYFVFVGSVLAKQGEQQKSGFDILLGNDLSKVDIDAFAKSVVNKATAQLGGEACPSKAYRSVLAPEVVGTLMSSFISHSYSEEVQKNSSVFMGKLDQLVASKKVTIEEKPLLKNVFARYFDDEGVATYNKAIVKNGVLKTYLYNLTTGAKEGKESTGNGYKSGSKIGLRAVNLSLKPGKKSFEELCEMVGNGVYITSITGLHAGLNAQSGNFSLQGEGFLIKDGKVDHALDVITVAGNLFTLFKSIQAVGADSKLLSSGVTASSVVVKKLQVGGK